MTSAHRPDDDGSYADVSAYACDTADNDVEPGATTTDESAPSAAVPQGRARDKKTGLTGGRKVALLVVGAAAGLGLFVSVYQMGQPAATTMPANHPPVDQMTAATQSPAPLNETLVGELTARVDADPADAAALRGLAEEYSRVGDLKAAAGWQAKLVELNPNDKDNRLILGVTYYNDAQYPQAEEQWLTAAALDPADPGPWYNLGFLYLSLDPPADQLAEEAWSKVVELAPGSEMAQTVSEHLDRLDSMPAASPAPDATPGG
ncbi:MAG: tetratricopeptide repeat protein [Propionibacteriaceae bacterium]|nr:tetratricopeptide repeat protein [Propionibacteriaceae bacterium]